jgi:hypothetical protein
MAFLLIFLFNMSFGGWAQAQVACQSAHALPPSLAKLERVLERKVQVVHLPPRGGFYQIELFTDNGERELGSLTYQPNFNGQVLQVLIIHAHFQRFGIGEALIEQALLKFPQTNVMATWALVGVNKQELTKALAGGATPIMALQQTPAYKIGAALGFTEIIPESINAEFDFAARRPTRPRSRSRPRSAK